MKQHVVEQGEHLSRIARQYGLNDYEVLWELPENAELKEKRQNPNVLLPGDVFVIPDAGPKEFSVPTGQRHKFVLPGTPLKLRLKVQDIDRQPVANTDCELHVEGKAVLGGFDTSGKNERKTSFVGYLQDCLSRSDF